MSVRWMPCSILSVRTFHLRSKDTGPRRRIRAPLALVTNYWILSTLSLPLFSSISQSPLHEDFLLLYSTLKLIRALHLLTIWTFTWVPVPSDIHLIFLWVALAEIILFTCLLYINAARKVASLHLMRQLWLPPGRLTFSSCLGWFLTVCRVYVGLPFGVSEEALLLGRPLK